MDWVTIGIVAFGVLFIVGGIAFSHYGNKKILEEETKNQKNKNNK